MTKKRHERARRDWSSPDADRPVRNKSPYGKERLHPSGASIAGTGTPDGFRVADQCASPNASSGRLEVPEPDQDFSLDFLLRALDRTDPKRRLAVKAVVAAYRSRTACDDPDSPAEMACRVIFNGLVSGRSDERDDAWELWYRAALPEVKRWIRRKAPENAMEDVAQDIFMHLLRLSMGEVGQDWLNRHRAANVVAPELGKLLAALVRSRTADWFRRNAKLVYPPDDEILRKLAREVPDELKDLALAFARRAKSFDWCDAEVIEIVRTASGLEQDEFEARRACLLEAFSLLRKELRRPRVVGSSVENDGKEADVPDNDAPEPSVAADSLRMNQALVYRQLAEMVSQAAPRRKSRGRTTNDQEELMLAALRGYWHELDVVRKTSKRSLDMNAMVLALAGLGFDAECSHARERPPSLAGGLTVGDLGPWLNGQCPRAASEPAGDVTTARIAEALGRTLPLQCDCDDGTEPRLAYQCGGCRRRILEELLPSLAPAAACPACKDALTSSWTRAKKVLQKAAVKAEARIAELTLSATGASAEIDTLRLFVHFAKSVLPAKPEQPK